MTDDSDQHRDKRPRFDVDRDEEVERMDVEVNTLYTNHDRQDGMEVDDDDQRKELQSPSVRRGKNPQTTLEQQKDMGEPFLLRRSSKTLLPFLVCRMSPCLQIC